MNYIFISEEGNQYPFSLQQLRNQYPNVSFPPNPTPEDLAPFNCFPVEPSKQPNHDYKTQMVLEGKPRKDKKGKWKQTWVIKKVELPLEGALEPLKIPEVDWFKFKKELHSNSEISDWFKELHLEEPLAAITLALSAISIDEGRNVKDFRACWLNLRRKGKIPEKIKAIIIDCAEKNSIPESFLSLMP